ncbi:MAG: F-type H+-transporting ATPase subunit alpha [Parcubacteria group bacterium Gr01-1014_18]|nr:MAG: F-type H+-transporting ATPase subunit alpha [Parcubacteria group bacterium Greene0416_36]TSC80854.1 MAG: F-type H+-transporting ATPase subunit alpha [Parcubacteria group bacterium Gr01-1014_18]TSC99515.1 MAG: F-type H+-transporting ATPase subunit alpha [Parcubacteria group bacterium Greene1014_20]TSD07566.1 MAG: F-type H+-transporting ATPase subunit alpha [Parcubacteria group bacterium Greene0714_2]
MSKAIIEQLKKNIDAFSVEVQSQSMGVVEELSDGVVKISGLRNVQMSEMLSIETEKGPVTATVFNLEEYGVGAVVLGSFAAVRAGQKVTPRGQILSVPVSESVIGRVVNALGEPVDGKGMIPKDGKTQERLVEYPSPGVLDRESVKVPLHTGIKAIDGMIPIGRGQRQLIIGDRQTGKTSLVLDAIINQQNDTRHPLPICIYVAIGQKQSTIARVARTLEDAGALKYTIIVAASATDAAPLQFLAPYAGVAIGEYFMEKGRDVLIAYDDLSKHAVAYRQISLLLRRPPGREAYPGDIFYLHSRLLERAAKLSKEKGSGSITALPIIETQLGDVSAYIPTNVISITDGQIYLEADLFHQGIRPAVNVGLSVSRVGSAAQTKAMKKVAGKIRLELAQFRELQAFVQFASELDEATTKRIKRGKLLTEALKQTNGDPLGFQFQVILFYAATNGFMDGIPDNHVRDTEAKLYQYFKDFKQKDILDPIAAGGEITPEIEAKIKEALTAFIAGLATKAK